MKLINVIGYSGSGKTHLIAHAIKKLKSELDLTIIVIKNVHTHKIDTEGKDSFKFSDAGADFSVIRNKYNEVAIFFKKDLHVDRIIELVMKLSDHIDLVFAEGFRDLKVPTILCVKNLEDINTQLNPNIKMISGLVSTKGRRKTDIQDLPIVNIKTEFDQFLEIFDIRG
jgi:molybdopterin-guanine dinucleotide biosynthesis protein B